MAEEKPPGVEPNLSALITHVKSECRVSQGPRIELFVWGYGVLRRGSSSPQAERPGSLPWDGSGGVYGRRRADPPTTHRRNHPHLVASEWNFWNDLIAESGAGVRISRCYCPATGTFEVDPYNQHMG